MWKNWRICKKVPVLWLFPLGVANVSKNFREKNVWKEPQKAQYYVGNIRKTEYTKMAQTFITILYIYYVKQFWKIFLKMLPIKGSLYPTLPEIVASIALIQITSDLEQFTFKS